jgi:Ca2+-transporting ATPase
MDKWYGSSWNNVVREFESDINTGITSSSIEKRKRKHGENLIKIEKEKVSLIKKTKNFDVIHIVLNIVLTILFILEGKIFEGIALNFTLLLYLSFELYQYKMRNDRAKQIERLNNGKVSCIRDGVIQILDAAEIVVGDIIILKEGGTVPADVRVIESENLFVKESSVTGKNEIIEKYETRIYGEVENLWEIKNIIFKSSAIIKGECTGVVVAVGMETQIGKIVSASNIKEERDEFFRAFKTLTSKFKNYVLSLIILVALYSWMQKNPGLEIAAFIKLSLYSLYLNITIIIGIIFSLYLKKKMKMSGVDHYNIFSMQKIANIESIIINDRGFICEEEMHAKEFYCNGVHTEEFSIEALNEYNANRMLQIAVLCNNAKTVSDAEATEDKSYAGDSVETGILRFTKSKLFSKTEMEKIYPRLFQIPMDSDKNIMTTVNKVDECYRANVKGEIEEILKRCTHIMKNGMEIEINQSDTEAIKSAAIQMSNKALQVIGFAYRNFNYEPSLSENIESHLVFAGLIGMENPAKNDSVSNLEKCKKLNIKTILITENNKLYAFALGKKLGVIKRMDEILSGIEFKFISKEEQNRISGRVKIFSKIFVEDKIKLVKYFKAMNKVTAICTNNFNDLPAFSEAAVGIGYGEKCSNTIKRMSDIFISKNSLYSLITLIMNCRMNLIRINMAFYYFMVMNLTQISLIMFQQVFFSLNITYTFSAALNLVFVPLNIIFILFRKM